MSLVVLAITVVGFYFMLGSDDAYRRFNVSFRNQNIFLMCMFGLYAIRNVIRIAVGLQVGAAFPIFALVFLFIDLYLVKLHMDRL